MAVVADDHCIINTMGVRFIEKIDATSSYGRTDQPYLIRVTYKGSVLSYGYTNSVKRDKQYDALREVMTATRRSKDELTNKSNS
jgi:hypothetical protein